MQLNLILERISSDHHPILFSLHNSFTCWWNNLLYFMSFEAILPSNSTVMWMVQEYEHLTNKTRRNIKIIDRIAAVNFTIVTTAIEHDQMKFRQLEIEQKERKSYFEFIVDFQHILLFLFSIISTASNWFRFHFLLQLLQISMCFRRQLNWAEFKHISSSIAVWICGVHSSLLFFHIHQYLVTQVFNDVDNLSLTITSTLSVASLRVFVSK